MPKSVLEAVRQNPRSLLSLARWADALIYVRIRGGRDARDSGAYNGGEFGKDIWVRIGEVMLFYCGF